MINEDPTERLIAELRGEVSELKRQLKGESPSVSPAAALAVSNSASRVEILQEEVRSPPASPAPPSNLLTVSTHAAR